MGFIVSANQSMLVVGTWDSVWGRLCEVAYQLSKKSAMWTVDDCDGQMEGLSA